MSDHRLDAMHTEIEVIFNGSVDHVHADTLHRFIDEQQAEIERLTAENRTLRNLGITNADEIERLKKIAGNQQHTMDAQRKEIERLRADWRIQNDHIVKINAENAKLQAVVGAAQKEIDNHDAGRGMTVKYLRQTIAALDTVDNQGCPTCGDKALDHDREECKRLDFEEYVAQVGGGIPHTVDADKPKPKMYNTCDKQLFKDRGEQESIRRLTDAIVELSKTWAEHPSMPNGDLWDGPCICQECCSYEGTNDTTEQESK